MDPDQFYDHQMFSWVWNPGHSLGPGDAGNTSFPSAISDSNTHVLRKGTFPEDCMDLADVISSQTQINRLLHEIETLEAEVPKWKKLSQSSTQGQDTTDSDTVWNLRSTITDLEQRRVRELDQHQLEVAVLQNNHWQKLQDVRHQLEESILRNNKDSLQNNIAVRALKIEKGRLVAKLCRAEKKLLGQTNQKSEQIHQLSPAIMLLSWAVTSEQQNI